MSGKETLEQFGSCWEGLEDPRSGNAALHDFRELLRFRDSFQRFMAQFSEQLQGVVAIDGKVLRRSFGRTSGKPALHMAGAWGSEQRLVSAQIAGAEGQSRHAV